jgi:hypothetical protein
MRRTAACGASARAVLLLGAAGAGCAVVWRLADQPLALMAQTLRADGVAGLARLPFDAVLVGSCAAVALLCCGWLLLSLTVLVTQVLVTEVLVSCTETSTAPVATTVVRGRRRDQVIGRVAELLCPDRLRIFVVAGCGVAITGGLAAAPVAADPVGVYPSTVAHAPSGPVSRVVAGGLLSGLPVPDRAVDGHSSAPRRPSVRSSPPTSGAAPVPRTVRVRAGDSLWAIAERLLPPGADDQRVSAGWHRLLHANLARIGANPDLIFPGTTLRVPVLEPSLRREHQ